MRMEVSGTTVTRLTEAVLHPDNAGPEYIEARRVLANLREGDRIYIGRAYKPLAKCPAIRDFLRARGIRGEYRRFLLSLVAHEASQRMNRRRREGMR